jgi:hypothetical protein
MNVKRAKAVILDHCPPLTISYINKALSLRRIGRRSKQLNLYSINPVTGEKEVQASILVIVSIDIDSNDFVELHFNLNGKTVIQQIPLSVKTSNLRTGHRYYFRYGDIRSHKLYFNGKEFVPRKAIENPHYLSQIQSRKERSASKDMKAMIRLQKIAIQGKKKYFKRYYDGNLTKRYMKILEANDSLDASW